MEKIIFIDPTSANTHLSIKNKGIGASEYQLYNLINNLSKFFNIECYYNGLETNIIDDIKYCSLYNDFKNKEINSNDIFIIQRFMPDITGEIYKKIKNNKIFIWNHDLIQKSNFVWCHSTEDKNKCNFDEYFKNNIINEYFNNKNIHYIFVSKTIKKDFKDFTSKMNYNFEKNRLHYIYNILYEDEFIEIKNAKICKNPYLLTYASALHKGIEKIISIFEKLLQYNNNFILQIMSPGYEWNKWTDYLTNLKNKYKDNIIVIGPVNKNEYSKYIKKSLCVLSGTFYETFGCVFAESYYLGIPVIADYRSGAIKEIIDNNYILNYDDVEIVIKKILELQNEYDKNKIFLNEKFLLEYNISKWLKKIKGMNKNLYTQYDSQYNIEGGCWNKSTCLKDGIIETYSGPGSLLENTDTLVENLNHFIKEYKIKTIIDIPCGDFNFMSKVILNDVKYIGYDISKQAIKKCKKYETKNIKFSVFDATIETIPYADFILCKDLFLHLSFADINKILNNIVKSKCKYFGVSRYSLGNVINKDQVSGLGCRAIEITKEPFNFNKPIIKQIYNTSKQKIYNWMSDQIIIFELL